MHYGPEKKIAPSALQSDFSHLYKTLQTHHPALNEFTSKDSLDYFYHQVFDGIKDSATEEQFATKVAWFVSKIRSGHTSLRYSKESGEYYKTHQVPRFPLVIKTWKDSMIVLGSFNKADSVFTRGTAITSIENKPVKTLLDSMFTQISTDGYSDNFKSQVISFNFPMHYGRSFPVKDSFLIKYVDSSGLEQSRYVKAFKIVKDTSGKKLPKPMPKEPFKLTHKERKKAVIESKRSVRYDSAYNMTYMRVATFSSGNLRKFFRQQFKVLNKDHVQNLVIDLRENSGGSINLSTLFSRYVVDHPFNVADSVTAVTRHFKKWEHITPTAPYALAMQFSAKKINDSLYHFPKLERHLYKPFTNRLYKGNVFIIQGGYTFSAATMFVNHVKGQKNVKIIGEETGGGAAATDAVYLPEIILPASKLRVVLPIYHVVINTFQPNKGRGIMPDYIVEPSSFDIRRGIDPKIIFIQEYIKKSQTK